MRTYTLEAYEDKLVHQVIHLDQGACYSPEFRATRMMHDYPSRKLQLAWSVYKGYLPPTEYIASLLFQFLLSRQGERWQNFGECAEDLTDAMILCREMMVKQGFAKEVIQAFKRMLDQNGGHVCPLPSNSVDAWRGAIPTDPASSTYLLIDDATAAYAADCASSFGRYFKEQEIAFYPEIQPTFLGWEYFACGLVDEGITHLQHLVDHLIERHISTVVVLSGQARYLLTKYLEKLSIAQPYKVVDVLDECRCLKVREPSYLYAGSFNLRYLDRARKMNDLVKNDREESIKDCAEFTPLLSADHRVNQLTCWQKPVCAEYSLVGCDPAIVAAIMNDAIADIAKPPHSQVIVFEPYAYHVLKNKLQAEKISYYSEVL
jgi:hypothetical protein